MTITFDNLLYGNLAEAIKAIGEDNDLKLHLAVYYLTNGHVRMGGDPYDFDATTFPDFIIIAGNLVYDEQPPRICIYKKSNLIAWANKAIQLVASGEEAADFADALDQVLETLLDVRTISTSEEA